MNESVEEKAGGWEQALVEVVRDLYGADATGHDYYHSLRVHKLTRRLQQAEGGDVDVLAAAAYLHDMGRVLKGVTRGHSLIAADAAPDFLARVDFPMEKCDKVVGCIRYHGLYASEVPHGWRDVIEIPIFQDADRLDATGAIGIARAFTYGGATGKPIWVPESQIAHLEWVEGAQSQNTLLHFYEKLLKIDKYLNTATAKMIAGERLAYMRAFVDRFFAEWEGML